MTGSAAAETVLAFDFGEKRVGVAVGNGLLRSATALETISAVSRDALFARIAALIAEWQPQQLVVGVPYPEHGDEPRVPSASQQRCERFANRLHGRFGLPVERVDERYSSVDADTVRRGLRESRLSRRTGVNDQLAAQVILQRYFDERPAASTRPAASIAASAGNHAV